MFFLTSFFVDTNVSFSAPYETKGSREVIKFVSLIL
jgi:hypothetical protein